MSGPLRSLFSIGVCVAASIWALRAQALIADVSPPPPSLVGDEVTFRAVVSDAVGAVRYRWNITQWAAQGVDAGLTLELETTEASYAFTDPRALLRQRSRHR
jgi:hypothetical protein